MTASDRAAALGLTGAPALAYIIASITAKADLALERNRP